MSADPFLEMQVILGLRKGDLTPLIDLLKSAPTPLTRRVGEMIADMMSAGGTSTYCLRVAQRNKGVRTMTDDKAAERLLLGAEVWKRVDAGGVRKNVVADIARETEKSEQTVQRAAKIFEEYKNSSPSHEKADFEIWSVDLTKP